MKSITGIGASSCHSIIGVNVRYLQAIMFYMKLDNVVGHSQVNNELVHIAMRDEQLSAMLSCTECNDKTIIPLYE